ncbi:MAG: serine/threonine protein kinase [Lentisphaerales bacterium]|nr:serine/threonine protein kinase [Lentisphaerales bacterium]
MSQKNVKTTAMDKTSVVLKDEPENEQILKKNNKYRIHEKIAQGGTADIFLAKDSNCRRNVALKVMQNADNLEEETIHRFIEEAQIAAQLDHPNILPIYDLTTDGQGTPFYAMKLVKGDTLESILNRLKAQDPKTTAEYPLSKLLIIFQKICDGVAFAASRKVVHRDLKPENIMIGQFGEVFIMDWGIAKVMNYEPHTPSKASSSTEEIDRLRLDDSLSVQTTIQGQILGTPGFMAPEQVIDSSNVDTSADIYALGGILYNILTLLNPHAEIAIKPLMKSKIAGKIPTPEKRIHDSKVHLIHLPGKKIPSALSSVCQKAMSLNPYERYHTVEEFSAEINLYIEGYATQAEGASQWRLLKLLFLRHKRLGFYLFTLFAVIISFTVMNSLKLQDAEFESTSAKSDIQQSKSQISKNLHVLNTLRSTMRKLRGLTPEIESQVDQLVIQKDYKRALEVVNTFISFQSSETLYLQKINILIQLRERKKALKTIKVALREYPESEAILLLKKMLNENTTND